MPRVLLLSRQPLASRPLYEWLDNTADDIILLTTPKAVLGAEDVLATHFPRHKLVPDYHSWAAEQAALEAAREHGADLVASTSESDVLRAARLRTTLGLPGQDTASATAYRDKVVMKQLVRAAGLRVPEFAEVDSPLDLLDFIAVHGLPVVVKPRFGAGSQDVAILREDGDVTVFLSRERSSKVPYLPGQWMAETYVKADFFHVDGIMHDGRIVHAWPAQYSGGLVEWFQDQKFTGSVLLAPDDERTAVLMQMAADVVAALPPAPLPLAFHLETWIGADGVPALCEIASRAGGGLIAETYESVFGIQLAREGLRAQCGAALALAHQPAAPSTATGWVYLPMGSGEFVPPAEPCPVPGAELKLLIEPGTKRQGVAHITDAAASAFVRANTAEEVRKHLSDLTQWWNANAQWL